MKTAGFHLRLAAGPYAIATRGSDQSDGQKM